MNGRRRTAGIVSIAVMGSRLCGLVRELLLAALFGAGRNLDALLAAFQIPNLLRDLFAEGALSAAFTTTFARLDTKEGPAAAWRLTSLVLSAVIVILGATCLLGIALSPLLVHVTNYGFHQVPGKFELTVSLTRLLFPFILFVSLAAVVMGLLNARHVFGLPASASTVFNIVSVVTGVGLAYLFEPQADWRHPHFSERALHGVALGILLGGVAQLAVQIPALRRQGYRWEWQPHLRDPLLAHVWSLMWPSVAAGAAVQVNVLINGVFASEVDGARSWLNCAFRLMQFPIGVFGVAVATVTLPALAQHCARAEWKAFGQTVEDALRRVLFWTLPAAAGLAALAPRIIGVLYEHGRFTAADTAQTAAALRAYVVGLAAYAAIKVLIPCFTALGQPRTPLRISLLGIGVNLVLNCFFARVCHWGHVGVAATTSGIALINGLQLYAALRRDLPGSGWGPWLRHLAALGLAAGLCGAAALGASAGLTRLLAPGAAPGLGVQLLVLAAGLGAGAAAFAAAGLALRLPESTAIAASVGRLCRRLAGRRD